MLSIPTHWSRSMGLHVLVAIAFGITELPRSGSGIPPYKECENVSGKTICYFRGSEKRMTWNEARHLCNSFSATLPVIRNRNDQDFLAGYLRSNPYSIAWTAGKSFIHSNWTWINGRQLDETDQVVLQEDEARTEEEENYAVLNTAFNFTARAASVELTYICQYLSYVGIHCSPPADIVVANNCLRLINTKRSWFDARNHCLNTNGELAVISDDVLERLKKNLTMNGRYWIGLRKKSWLWSRKYNAESYDEIKYTNWDSNKPPRDGECISILTSNYKWKAVGCSESKTVVCQTVSDISTDTRPTTTPGSQGPNTSRTACAYCNSSTNILVIDKCLRFSVDNRTWYDARNQCIMGGGDLAIIDDADQMLAKTLSLNQSYWIGLRKTFWRWTLNNDAKSIEEIKYTNWNDQIFSKEGKCIVIEISSGKWKAHGCNELHAVVCRKGEVTISTSSTDTSLEDTKTEVESFTSVSEDSSTSGSQAFGVVGAVILIIVCVIAIIVFAMRTANRSVIELFQSKFNNNSTRNTHEELYNKTTHAPVNTSVSVPLYASLKRSDNDYDEITSTIIQLESDATNQQPGIDEEFLKCQKEFIQLEPDTKNVHTTVPNKIGPLGDIYAMPDAKSRAVTSPSGGSNSHPIIVTAKGDIYALPTKTSKLSTPNQPSEVFYANLQTEMLGKKEKTEDHCQTK